MKQIGLGLLQYTQDNDEYVPYWTMLATLFHDPAAAFDGQPIH